MDIYWRFRIYLIIDIYWSTDPRFRIYKIMDIYWSSAPALGLEYIRSWIYTGALVVG